LQIYCAIAAVGLLVGLFDLVVWWWFDGVLVYKNSFFLFLGESRIASSVTSPILCESFGQRPGDFRGSDQSLKSRDLKLLSDQSLK
jgi:hypothetical protein